MLEQDIKPMGNRILIKRQEAKSVKGGILLPDSAKEKQKLGYIIATGPGVRDEEGSFIPMQVKVGDMVLFSAYAGTEVKLETDGEYLIVTEEDVLGVIV